MSDAVEHAVNVIGSGESLRLEILDNEGHRFLAYDASGKLKANPYV